MKAIVTGATGFIGSWLVLFLIKLGDTITIIVRDKNKLLPEIRSNSNVNIIEKEIGELVEDDFKEDDIYEVCYHVAWGGVAPEDKNNAGLQLNNISMSLHLIDVCHKIHCNRFIATGTVAEYVFCDGLMDSKTQQSPNDMYGAAKTSTHYFLDVRARQLGMPFNWVVIPSTYGERRIDNNIITYTIKSLLKREKPLYGNLEQMWDFLYVEDVVRALRLIGEKGITNKNYGIGSGEYKTLKNYIIQIRDIINPDLELGIGEVPSLSEKNFSSCVNIFDLIKDTGFEIETSFEDGIKRTVEYWRLEINDNN